MQIDKRRFTADIDFREAKPVASSDRVLRFDYDIAVRISVAVQPAQPNECSAFLEVVYEVEARCDRNAAVPVDCPTEPVVEQAHRQRE